MYEIKFAWKEFSVNLQSFESYMRAEHPSYVGNSAAQDLTLHFSEEPSQQAKDDIQAYWDSLDGSDYKSQSQLDDEAQELKDAVAAAKSAMLAKSWDQLSAAEKKIAMNMEVSREEMGLE